MAIELGDAIWLIKSDDSPLRKGLGEAQSAVKGAMDGILSHSTQIGIGMAAVGASIVGFFGVALNEAIGAQDAAAQLDAAIKSTGGAAGLTAEALKAMASAMSDVSTFSDEAIIGAQSLLLTFTSIKDDVFPEATQAILDISTRMGTDLKSSALQVGKALNDPIKGVSALTDVGVSFTEQQQEMIRTMVEVGNVAGAQKLMLAELATEFGGSAAAAAGTFSGQMAQLKDDISEVFEKIGTALMPILSDFADAVVPIIESFAAWIENNPELAKTLAIVAAAVGVVLTVLAPLVIMLPGIVAAFTVLGPVLAGLAAPIAIAIAAIAALAAVGVALWYYWDEISAGLATAWEFIKDAAEKTWDAIGAYFQSRIEMFKAILSSLREAFFWVWDGIAGAFNAVYQTIGRIWDGIIGIFQWAGNTIMSFWNWILGMIQSGINGLIGAVDAVLGAFGGGIDWRVDLTGGGPPGRASGGPVMAGLPYKVGERGEELFVPETNGTIVPNGALAGLGTTNNFSVIVNGADANPREIATMVSRELHKMQLATMRAG